MKDMVDRVIKIREESGDSQEKFASRLGLSRNFINQFENRKKNISDRTISDICKEFNISEEWLRYGTGEMKRPVEHKLPSYVSEIVTGDDDFIKDLIEVYMELDQTSKNALKEIAKRMADKRNKMD